MTESSQTKMDTIITFYVERDNSDNEMNTLLSLLNLIAEDVSPPMSKSDRLHQVESLLKSEKFNVNILTSSSQNLLHLLCPHPLNQCQIDYDGCYEIAELLIENGVDVNQKDERGKTPLMYACQNGYSSVVYALMKLKWQHLDVNARDSSGESAFTIAGRNADYYLYERLIAVLFWQAVVTGDMNTATNFRNSSTEECAIRFDDLCVNSIKRRFPIDLRVSKLEYDDIFVHQPYFERPITSCITFYAWLTAILFADNRRNESMLKLLFDFEKIVRATTRSGLSALHLAVSCGENVHFNRIYIILVNSGRFDVNALTKEEETALHVTCRCRDPEEIESIIDLLIRNNINVNHRNSFGQTALMIACENENDVAVRKLLQWKNADGVKCDINVKDKDGKTALTFAYRSNNTELAEMIEQASLRNAIESGDFETIEPFFAEECLEIVCEDQELIAKEMKTRFESDGKIPDKEWNVLQRLVAGNLSQQIKSKRVDLVMIVLKSENFDVNILTSSSQNLLHLICLPILNNLRWDFQGYYEIAKLLIENGVDFNHKDQTGRTPLMLACEKGCDSVVKALLDWNSTTLDIDARETALTIAARNKNTKTFSTLSSELLLQYVKRNDIKAVTRLLNSSRNDCAICIKNVCMHQITIIGILTKDLGNLICAESDIEYPSESCVTFNGWLNAVKIADDCKYDSMLDLLVKFEEHVSGTRKDDHTALHLAVLHNQNEFEINELSAFEILLKSKRFDVNALTINLETVLHLTCRYLYSEKSGLLIEQLLRYKVNVNQRNIFGETALMIACENENTVAVRVLLLKWKEDCGEKLDIEARDNKGQTAVSIAQQSNNKEIEAIFEQRLFLRAVESGDIETVKTCMKRSSENGQTEENHMKRLNAGILPKPPSNKSESQSETRNNENQYEILYCRSTIDLPNLNDVTPLIDDEEIEGDEIQLMSGNSVTHSVFSEGVYMAYCKSEKENSHNEMLKVLLNDELYMHEPNEEGLTILHSAVEEYLENKCEPKGLRKIEILLNSCKCDVNALNSQKETVLHLVCSSKANENLLLDDLLKILLEYRIDLNLRNNSEKTALLNACENGNTNIVRTLLTLTRNNDIYLDVTAYDKPEADEIVNDNKRFGQMNRVSDFNMRGEKKKWKQTYSFDFETWKEAAIVAIENSFEEILNLLLDYDVVVQRQYGWNGETILTHCIFDEASSAKASLKLFVKLLESGKVNVNALDFLSCTALHEAFRLYDSRGLISLLLRCGINVNQKNFFGQTPIVYGIIHRDSSALREILNFVKTTDTWLDIDARDAFNRTALMWAAMIKYSDGVGMLLNAGASVNLTDNGGFTALHHALHEVMSGETWINYGDFPRNIQEFNHRKAIDVILYETEPHEELDINRNKLNEENIKIVKLLVDSDIDVNSLDCEGYSPMDIAVATLPGIPSHIKDTLKAKGAIPNVFQNKNKHSEGQANLNVNLLHRRANFLAFCTKLRKDTGKFYMLTFEKDNMAKENFSKLSANIQTQLISAKDQKRRTLLHRAIISGQKISNKNVIIESEVINVVKLLISLGCSVNETDIYGRTPLHYVYFKELKNLLISHGADQTAKDENRIEAIKMSKSLIAAAMIGKDRVSRIIQEIHNCMEEPKSTYFQRGKIEIQQGNIEWNDKFNPKTIPKLVWERGNYAFRHPSVNQFREEVKTFIENLASEITKRDWRFAVVPIFVGSSNEEIRLNLPDEFDFSFVLKTISQLCEVTFSPELPSGFVRLKRKQSENNSMTDKDFDNFFDNNSVLIIEKLKAQFQIILRDVLSDAQFIENHPYFDWDLDLQEYVLIPLNHINELGKTTLRLRNTKLDLDRRNVFHISIDIVPCIHIDGWWPEGTISKVSEEIKSFGCILVYDFPQRLYRSVPYSHSCVKISFAPAESELIKRSSDAAKQAYMIAKQLINKSDFDHLGCGTSYILKTSFLYCIEALAPTFEKASERRMSQDAMESKLQQIDRQLWLESIMKCHLDFVSQDFCPCYFMPSFSIPIKWRLKEFHMTCLTNDDFKLPNRLFEAYRLYRSVSLHASGFDFQLPPPNPVFEHFDREAMIANLRTSAIENLRNAPDTYVANETEQVEAATAENDDDDDDDDYDNNDADDDDNDDDDSGGSGCDDGDDGASDCDNREVREPE